MSIVADEIREIIKRQMDQSLRAEDFKASGTVVQVGDSIVRVYGMDSCMAGELIEFPGQVKGMALNLEESNVGCVLLSGDGMVREGDMATCTGKVVEVPVGPSLLGRVIDPLGKPLDGKGEIAAVSQRPVEYPAPDVLSRHAVDRPLQTGVLAVDAMIPIGRGQRELIIGDRQTGKTAIALDAILNQRGQNVICVYCAIGQKNSSTAAIVQTLERHGAMEYSVVVNAGAADLASLQYLAPYSACAIAEYFMYTEKRDVLVVYDDLSKHANAYRSISLLLRRPPGREAFPGDVFYLHSRLLERAAQLSAEYGGGSITALPIIETQAGDISAYIPTNTISITDGQIFLESELFNAGMRPAVNVGLSVSRVGGSAQTKAMRKYSGRLRLDLAQYRELSAFAQFGSDLDKATQEKLSHGARLMEALKQVNGKPYSMAEESLILLLVMSGELVELDLSKVGDRIAEFVSYVKTGHRSIFEELEVKGDVSRDLDSRLRQALADFVAIRKG